MRVSGRLKYLLLCVTLSVTSSWAPLAQAGRAEDARPDVLALAAERSWLAILDAGYVGASWEEASQYFQSQVDKVGWERAITGMRGPLGPVISRTLQSATTTSTVPGKPDRESVVAEYATVFEHNRTAVETVTCVKQDDGRWKVTGYFVR